MLIRLLQELASGNSRNMTDIARSLDISPLMVEQIVEDLSRLGYLEANATDCASQADCCGGCPASAGCKEPDRLWFLTLKGQSILQKRST